MKIDLTQEPERDGGSLRATITFEASALQLTLTPFGVVLRLDGCDASGESGEPALPRGVFRVALPAGAQVSAIAAKPLHTVRVSDEPIMVAPIQHPHPGMM